MLFAFTGLRFILEQDQAKANWELTLTSLLKLEGGYWMSFLSAMPLKCWLSLHITFRNASGTRKRLFVGILGWVLYTYLHPIVGADEVSMIFTAIHDEGDGLDIIWVTQKRTTVHRDYASIWCCHEWKFQDWLQHPFKSTYVQNKHRAHICIADCKRIGVMNVRAEVHWHGWMLMKIFKIVAMGRGMWMDVSEHH
jgi:hypothetical protein